MSYNKTASHMFICFGQDGTGYCSDVQISVENTAVEDEEQRILLKTKDVESKFGVKVLSIQPICPKTIDFKTLNNAQKRLIPKFMVGNCINRGNVLK